MKLVKLNDQARGLVKNGVNLVADAVKTTLGPEGRNALIDRTPMTPLVTNDGVTIAMHVEAEDEFENIGVHLMKMVAAKTNDEVGDGTTSSTVLAQAIIDEVYGKLNTDLIGKKPSIVSLKNEIEENCTKVITELKKMSTPVKTDEDMLKVAETSMENKEIAKLIVDVFKEVKADGVITIEDSFDYTTTFDIIEGAKLSRGYATPYVMNNNKRECVVEDAHILLTKEVIVNINQIKHIVEELAAKKITNLVILAKDFTPEILNIMIVNKVNSAFQFLPIKNNSFREEELEDLASITGATLFDNQKKVADCILQDLGKAKKVISKMNESYIIDGAGDIKAKVKELEEEKKGGSVYKKDKIQARIANLTGGVAIIKVGATTEVEREYLKHKIEDAVNALRAAMNEGIVPGGGTTLKKISEKLPDNILTNPLKAPYNQIQENAGGKLTIKPNVIDPTKVVRVSLENACSVAKTLITTETTIAIKKEDDKDKK